MGVYTVDGKFGGEWFQQMRGFGSGKDGRVWVIPSSITVPIVSLDAPRQEDMSRLG